MTSPTEIEAGDHVFVGLGRVHWIVERISTVSPSFAWLESGITGRLRLEPIQNLRLHTKGATSS